MLVVGVRKTGEGPRLAAAADVLPVETTESLQRALASIGATGAPDEVIRVPSTLSGVGSIALVGLGAGVGDPDQLRSAAGAVARRLVGVERMLFAFPAPGDDAVSAVLEGAAIGAYSYVRYKRGTREGARTPVAAVAVVGEGDAALADRAGIVADAVHQVRDLVAAPPSDLYPETFAAEALSAVADLPIDVEVLDEERLRDGGYGGILGVGQGSSRGPRLVVLRYSPDGAERHLSLVGKGITFDSGGLSLKPAASMVGMKYDMAGAATALAVIVAAARLRLPIRVTARLCLAENLPSGTAIRPNDVLRMRGGSTVEVLNTDAEGRLVLADGLVDASAENPDALIDVATLTGAARIAIGERTIPVMGEPELAARIVAAGARAGEGLWAMPMPAELRSTLDSDIADLANARPGNPNGGMLVAAHFLAHFVGSTGDGPDRRRIPWAHLDIAGAADNRGSGYGFTPKGPTGAAVRALIAVAEDLA